MTRKRILITGGAGFIGSAFTRKLFHEDNLDLLVVDKMTYSSNLNALPGDPREYLQKVDLADSKSLDELILGFD